jgi:DNA-binding XRE family transcriptional regulator
MTETVGRRIQRLAQERKLPSGKALASLLGVRYETLRAWTAEGGKIAPNRQRAVKIARLLGVSVPHLMYGVDVGVSLSPDAQALAEAFDEVAKNNYEAIERRAKLYGAILQLIDLHIERVAPASAQLHEPGAPPIALPGPHRETRS